MRKNLKFISLLLCISLLFTFNISNLLAATNATNVTLTDKQLKVIEDNDKVCTVMAEYQGDELYATLNKITKEITMQSIEKPKSKLLGGNNINHNYKVKVDHGLKGALTATVTDIETQKEAKLSKDSDKVQAQVAIVVPLVELLGASLLNYLLQVAAYIVIAGLTYVSVTKIWDQMEDPNYDYYAAYTVAGVGGEVYIGGTISYNSAVARLKLGGMRDVWSRTSNLAYGIAYIAGLGNYPVGPEIGSGAGEQYPHYHLWNRSGSHSFFTLWS